MFGFGTVEYTSSKNTVQLSLKKPGDNDTITLREVVESVVPPVRLNPLLSSGHLQTLYVSLGKGPSAKIHYKRRLFVSDNTSHPGQFTTDWVIPAPKEPPARDPTLPPRTHDFTEEEFTGFTTGDDNSKPLLIALHGLSGGSHEQYVRHCIAPLTSAEGGFDAVVINSRGCCFSKITTSKLFNARSTWDLRQLVKWIRLTWPERRLFAIGFSLGANILCNYLGEEGADCELEAGILVGNPWNLDVSNAILCNSFIGLHIYQRGLASGLKKLFERNLEVLSQNPDIDVQEVRNAKYLYEWDRYVYLDFQ
jgi:predicted alpha/beta-fold hydrolase